MPHETNKEKLRANHLSATNKVAEKQRFGFFTIPPPVGLGDSSGYEQIIPDRTENNGVITQPPNVVIKAPQEGKIPKSYFSDLGYVTVGTKQRPNTYIEPARLALKEATAAVDREKDTFKPSDIKESIKASYTYGVNDGKKLTGAYYRTQIINHRDENGKVIIETPNVQVNPINKTLFKFRKHMKDEYNREQLGIKKAREEHQKKVKEGFRNMHGKNLAFDKDKVAFGETQKQPPKKNFPEPVFKNFAHDQVFKPSHPPRQGKMGTLEKFPKYQADPMKVIKKKEEKDDKAPFKPNHGGNLSRPCPTISCNPINIRKCIHH